MHIVRLNYIPKGGISLENLLKTPLYPVYEQYGAKIVDFAGWALPLQFEGILPEHHTVREAAGLFDVSHMGEIDVTGEDALLFLNHLLSNDLTRIKDYQIQYNIMLNENGGAVDDVLVYRFCDTHFLVIANAANKQKDFEWMKSRTEGYRVTANDTSDEIAQLALQGPKAIDILKAAAGDEVEQIRFFRFSDSLHINGVSCLVSRTGYTGEDGFEIYVKPEHAIMLWDYLLELGKPYGLKPAGLGCRDTLRFEAGLPLYGHELAEDISPLEAGLGTFVKLEKPDFIGKQALVQQTENGIPRKLTGFEMIGRGIPRGGYEIAKDGKVIGHVTTGYFAPTLQKNIGMALMDAEFSEPGTPIEIIIRGKAAEAVTISLPFYSKKYKK
jgi:aminomethyltransferase